MSTTVKMIVENKATYIPNMIKFQVREHDKVFKFEPCMCFMSSTAISMQSNERACGLSIQITDHEKVKNFLNNPFIQ